MSVSAEIDTCLSKTSEKRTILVNAELNMDESKSEVALLCPTLCEPMDCSLPGFSVHGIFPSGLPEWVAISFSKILVRELFELNQRTKDIMQGWLNFSIFPLKAQTRVLLSLGNRFLLILNMKVKVKSLSCVRLFVTPWTGACQAPMSMEFSRHEYWSGWPFPSPGEYSWPPGQIPVSCIAGRFFTVWAARETTRKAQSYACICIYVHTHTFWIKTG